MNGSLGKSWKVCSNKLIKSNSKLLRFYTGFPNYDVFSTVLSFLGSDAAS